MPTVALLLLALGIQDSQGASTRIDQLVDQLRSLSPDATGEDFLKRPAMSKLMALGPAAFPALKKVFLTDDHWAVKASVGYLVITMAQSRDADVTRRRTALCADPNPFVRATMASLFREFARSDIGQVPTMNAQDRAMFDRLRLEASLHWMTPDDLRKLAVNSFLILEAGRPFLEPPAWESQGMRTHEGNVSRLRSVGVRVLAPQAQMAQLCLYRVFASPGAHDAVPLVMKWAEADDGSDPPRLGLKLRLACEAVGHGRAHIGGYDRTCPVTVEYKERLFEVAKKWAWTATDPNAQYGVIWALGCVSLWKAHDLLQRMAKDHPDAQVREFAGSELNGYWNRMLDRGWTRDVEKEADEQLKQRWQRRSMDEEKVASQSQPPERPVTTPEPASAGSWGWGALAAVAVLGIGLVVLIRRRA